MLVKREFLSARIFDIELVWYPFITSINWKHTSSKICLHIELS